MTNKPRHLKSLDEIEGEKFPREKQAPINLRSVRLIDMVRFREGTAVRLIPVKPKKQNVDLSWKIEYVPDRGMFEGIAEYINLFIGRNITKVTNEQFPDSAVHTDIKLDWDSDGSPEDCVLILENEEGKAPLREKVFGRMEETLADLEEEKSEAKGKALAEKAKNLANEGGKRSATQKESPNKSKNRNRDRDRDRKSKRNKRRKSRGGN